MALDSTPPYILLRGEQDSMIDVDKDSDDRKPASTPSTSSDTEGSIAVEGDPVYIEETSKGPDEVRERHCFSPTSFRKRMMRCDS